MSDTAMSEKNDLQTSLFSDGMARQASHFFLYYESLDRRANSIV